MRAHEGFSPGSHDDNREEGVMSLATVEPARQARFYKSGQHENIAARLEITPLNWTRCAVSCSTCASRKICLPCGLDADKLSDVDELTRRKRRVSKGSCLYRNGDVFESLHAIRSGSFKSVGATRAGDEKVTGLYLPGELMGLDAINARCHRYDAIALEDSEVCIVPYAALTQLASRRPQLQAQLFRMLSGDISRDGGLMLLMGSMDARQRIAAFLLSLSRRYEKLGYASTRFRLRLTRGEIGSYLGLTLETVSRVLSCLERDGMIGAQQKEVQLKDVAGLHDMVGFR
jgi:CRP/FNR family transcriptional regulator, anaerobic regulatory protein